MLSGLRSGRPSEAVTPEHIKQVLKIVMDDRKLKVREIAKMVKISTGSASTILNEKLGIKKVFQMGAAFAHNGTKATTSRRVKTIAKLSELGYELLPHPPYSPDLAPSDYWLFADLKKMLQGKRFGSNEEVIAETEAYFEAKDKSFYKHDIEKLEKRWNDCIALEGDYIDE